MSNIFNSPSKYVQGHGELGNLYNYAKLYGKKPLIIISKGGYKRSGATINSSFEGSESTPVYDYFNGECCKSEINRLRDVMKAENCDFVIGVGGGKILDTAKTVAHFEETPVIICPTVASTDAPCSALAVIYTENGEFEEYIFFRSNPDLVLMDIDVIVSSPARLTVSGMGDALATYFEARACDRSDAMTCAGGHLTRAAIALAGLCYETLINEGLKAKLALESSACTKAVENVIEANTLLSGIGFESGGLSGAHAIHNGLTVLPECHNMYHGEKVAFGTLTQLMLENADEEEIDEVVDFCISVDLPITFEQLGISDITDEKLMAVAEATCSEGESIYNMPFEINAEMVVSALKAADAYGRYSLGL